MTYSNFLSKSFFCVTRPLKPSGTSEFLFWAHYIFIFFLAGDEFSQFGIISVSQYMKATQRTKEFGQGRTSWEPKIWKSYGMNGKEVMNSGSDS